MTAETRLVSLALVARRYLGNVRHPAVMTHEAGLISFDVVRHRWWRIACGQRAYASGQRAKSPHRR
jgi:hypothetical protein